MKNLNSFGGFGSESDDDSLDSETNPFGSSTKENSFANDTDIPPQPPLILPRQEAVQPDVATEAPTAPLSDKSINFLLNTPTTSKDQQPSEQPDTHSDQQPGVEREYIQASLESQHQASELADADAPEVHTSQTEMTQQIEHDQFASNADQEEPAGALYIEHASDAAEPAQSNEAAEAGSSGGGPNGPEDPPSENTSSQEEPNNRENNQSIMAAGLSVANAQPRQAGAAPNQVPQTPERDSNAVGPAIVAFLAANYFRRRDKRRQKRVNKQVQKQVKASEESARDQQKRARTLEQQQTQKLDAQQQRLKSLERQLAQTENEVNEQTRRLTAAEQQLVQQQAEAGQVAVEAVQSQTAASVSEVLASAPASKEIVARLRKHQEASLPEPTAVDRTAVVMPASPEAARSDDLQALVASLESDRSQRTEQVAEAAEHADLLLQNEQSREVLRGRIKESAPEFTPAAKRSGEFTPDDVSEAPDPQARRQERMHERKDAASSQGFAAQSYAHTNTQAVQAQSTASSHAVTAHATISSDVQSTTTSLHHKAQPQAADVYKQSIMNGFVIGLAIIVFGLVAYFFVG